MGVFQNNLMGAAAAAASAGGGDFYDYQIANSVRNSYDQNGTMLRTPGTPSSTTTMTLSMWIQKQTAFPYANGYSSEGVKNLLFTSGSGSGYIFITTDAPGLKVEVGGVGYLITNALLRDTNSWYHIVLRVDTTQGTTANRVRFYINGVEPTYSNVTAQSISQNAAFPLCASGVAQGIGGVSGIGHGVIGTDTTFAEVVFNDGQSYGPDSYGETKNGVWIPKDPSGLTFGNQGFHLNFASSGDLGNDVSGNNNDFAIANIPASDQLLSSPTFNSDSNGGNFNTLNAIDKNSADTGLLNGGLTLTTTSSDRRSAFGTMGVSSGKWYFESRQINDTSSNGYPLGIQRISEGLQWKNWTHYIGSAVSVYDYSYAMYNKGAGDTSEKVYNDTWTTLSSSSAGVAGTIFQMAFDLDAGKIWFGINNTWTNSGNPSTAANPVFTSLAAGTYATALSISLSGSHDYFTHNYGQDGTFAGTLTGGAIGTATDATGYGAFKYAPPTDFLALCSGNLPVADAIDPAQTSSDYPQELFSPTLYTGTGADINVPVGFQPDWTWVKKRNGGYNHAVYDSSRGVTKYLTPDDARAEVTSANTLKAFISNGFTFGSDATGNENNASMVSWNWRANGGTTASNGNGDIASVTQVDPSGGFSIVTYTGSGTAGNTIGHGLSTTPEMIIIKNRSSVDSWAVYHSSLGNTIHFALDTDAAQVTSSAYWNSTSPTSTVFTVGTGDALNQNTKNYVAYCFANIEGYCKLGSYVGNANNDGPFLYTGFKPAFFMCKPILQGNWRIQDNKRTPVNIANKTLFPNSASAELSNDSNDIDILSNGIKFRANDSDYNQATTFVYLAFAENPFKYATAR